MVPRPFHLLEVLRAVSKKLDKDKGHKLSRLNDGCLLYKCLTLSGGVPVSSNDNSDPEVAWTSIRQRLNTVFAADDLIDWQSARKLKMSRESMTSLSTACDDALLGNTDLMATALLVLFTSSVHDQRSSMWEILVSPDVSARVQTIIERAFKTLLDNRTVLTHNILLKVLSEFGTDNSGNETGSPSTSFTYSPKSTSTPKTPLQKFRSPETTQVIKFQKIAQEQTRCLRQARVELDQEKADSEYLRKEVARLKKDQESYKRALDETRDKLAAKADPVSPHEIEQLRKANVDLQRKMVDRKDEEKYYKGLESKYEALMESNRDLKAKMASQKNKLVESSTARAMLESQSVEFRGLMEGLENEKNTLEEIVDELRGQLKEMQEIKRPNPVMDISVDDPRPVCLSPPKTVDSAGQEVIGHAVILELQTQVSKLQEDVEAKNNDINGMSVEMTVLNKNLQHSASKLTIANKMLAAKVKEIDELHCDSRTKDKALQESSDKVTSLTADLQQARDNLSTLTSEKDCAAREYELKVNNYEKVIEGYKESITSLETKYEVETKQHSEEIESMRLSISKAKEREEIVTASLEEVNTLMAAQNKELDAVKLDHVQQLDKTNAMIYKLQQQVNEVTKAKNNIANDLEKSELEYDKLKKDGAKELDTLKTALDHLTNQNAQLQSQIDNAAKDYAKLTERHDLVAENLSEQMENVKARQKELADTKSAMQSVIDNLRNDNMTLQEEGKRTEKRLNEELDSVLMKHDQIEKNSTELRTHVEELQTDMSKLRADKESEVQRISIEMENVEAEKRQLDSVIIELKAEMENVKSEYSESSARAEDSLKALNEELDEAKEQNDGLAAANRQLCDKIEEIKCKSSEEGAKAASTLKDLDDQLKDLHAEKTELASAKSRLEEELQHIKRVLLETGDQSANSLKAMSDQLDIAKTERDGISADNSKLRTEMEYHRREYSEKEAQAADQVKALTNELDQLRASKEELAITYSEMQMKHEAMASQNSELLQTQESTLKTLTEQLDSERAGKEEIEKANAELMTEIENVKSEHTQLQEHQDFTVKTLSEQLENVLKDKEDLQSVKQSQAEEISELQNELREQVAKADELTAAREAAQAEEQSKADKQSKLAAHKEDIIDSLSQELETVRDESETYKKRAEVMQVENENNCASIKRLNDQLLSISQAHVSKTDVAESQISLLQSQLAEKTAQVESLTNAQSAWERKSQSVAKDLEDTKETLDTRTEECKQLLTSVTDLQQFLRREKDSAIELQKKEGDRQKALEEQATVQSELEERIRYLEKELADKEQGGEAKFKEEKEAALAEQKKRYEGRVKAIAEQVKEQYQAKINESLAKWQEDVDAREERIAKLKQHVNKSADFEEKYSMAKDKLGELAEAVEQANAQKAQLEEKYSLSKEAIRNLQTDLKQAQTDSGLKQKNESLQRELNLARNELRSLKVQNMAADTKIRMLQSEQHKDSAGSSGGALASRRQTLAPSVGTARVRYSSTEDTVRMTRAKSTADEDVFKMPCVSKHTPGRAKAGRTQSEASMPRRPPLGSGAFFETNDEAGEEFSSSYLTDLKDGRCNVDPSRLSELARRNTMVPPHLKSSYPAETQFFKQDQFKERDLQQGNHKDVSLITNKTAELSFDSPAMNTRNSRQAVRRPVAFTIEPDHPTTRRRQTSEPDENRKPEPQPSRIPRKRRSTTTPNELRNLDASNASDTSLNKSTSSTGSTKRSRRDQNLVTYSKPGPPTPARGKGNRSMNSSDVSLSNSINSSMVTPVSNKIRASRKVNDKTPLLETTNQSTKSTTSSVNRTAASSNRSLRSIGKTPMSLKKIMSKTFRKTKYDVKTGLKQTGLSPKKKLKL